MGKIRKVILLVMLFASVIGIIYSLTALSTNIHAYKQSRTKYNEIREIYHEAFVQPDTDEHQALLEINDDYVGWLSVKGMNIDIDYPVVQTNDNEYYLNHNFYKEVDWAGAVFMDYRNDADGLDDHMIIYAHNMKDGSMFGSLKDLLDADDSEIIRIQWTTRDDTYEYEVFSVYQTRVTDWMQVDFASESIYQSFIEALVQSSAKEFQDVALKENDRIITLATCTGRVSDERTVVHARLIKGN